MLTKVYLEGPMGQKFGREWEFEISSPREALRMVEANSPGLVGWLRLHSSKFTHYQVVVEYEDGSVEHLSEEEYPLQRAMKSISFVPVIEGAGRWGQAIVGAILIVVDFYFFGGSTGLWKVGLSLMIGGIISALTARPSNARLSSGSEGKTLTSEVFDGPTNTAQQGVPVPLIYGRCMVGSQVISAGLQIDQLIEIKE